MIYKNGMLFDILSLTKSICFLVEKLSCLQLTINAEVYVAGLEEAGC